MAASAFAMPLMNGSIPMKPVAGFCSASATRCSPPPKPLSRRTLAGAVEQRAQIGRCGAIEIERELRQQRLEQRRLPGLERMPLAPAEEGALALARMHAA